MTATPRSARPDTAPSPPTRTPARGHRRLSPAARPASSSAPAAGGRATIQGAMFLLIFRYVFGGAINVGACTYVDFLVPGFVVTACCSPA